MRAAVLLVLLASPALADEERRPLYVEVGKTVQTPVGYAMGHRCDDESIVRAEMKNGTAEDNLFVITGLKPGTTLCRAGVVDDRPTYLFEITVAPTKQPKASPKPTRPTR